MSAAEPCGCDEAKALRAELELLKANVASGEAWRGSHPPPAHAARCDMVNGFCQCELPAGHKGPHRQTKFGCF